MLNETMTFTLPDRIHRLMRLGGEAAAQDADAATYETLNAVATAWGNPEEPGLVGEIARWDRAGRPDAAQSSEMTRLNIWKWYQQREAETGIPATLVDASDFVSDRLDDLENDHDDAR